MLYGMLVYLYVLNVCVVTVINVGKKLYRAYVCNVICKPDLK